ncbi:MAG: FecR family protein [Candidatus Acidiferrales bacterium]
MKKHLASLAVIFLTMGVMSVSAPLKAQDQQADTAPPPPDQDYSQQAGQPDQSGPAPGVARVSVINGNVSTQRGDNGEWVAATVNTPVAVGDRVSTGPDGSAEIQLDSANVLRLSHNATAKIANVSRENIQVQVGQGLVTYAVVRPGEANAEIDTPNSAVHPDGTGEYRIQVNSDDETDVIVREGSADITEPQGSTHVNAGQMISIQGTDNPEYKTASAPSEDAWDSWNMDRDHQITSAKSWNDTDQYYTGSEDLDNYGTWSEVPDYGPVWIPQQNPNWAPYSDGQWVWEPYYGWTWVSNEPWGWAPYHYGRWFVYGDNWAWWPGPVVGYPGYYPIWSPAYVSFFGWGGGGFGVGFGFGNVGWLPCGPGDWYHPWWGRWGGRYDTFRGGDGFRGGDRDGFRPIGPRGDRSFSNVNEAFRNDRVRSGMISMRSNEFGRGAVHGVGTRMSEASFRQASMVSGRMPISPSRQSYSASSRAANPASFRHAPSNSQHFFSAAGRTNTASNGFGGRSLNNNVRTRESFGGNAGNSGARSFGNGSNVARQQSFGGSANQNRGAITSNRPGWHAFTPPQSGGNRGSQTRGFSGNNRGEASSNSFSRGNAQTQSGNRGGWEHFSPQTQQSDRGSNRSFNSPQSTSRGGSSNSYPRSYSRPQLNMRQPIVTPRGGGNYGNGGYNRNEYRGYSQPRGNYSAPRGNYSAPREYSAPRGNYSAPRGNYSGPRGNGGGGYNAPRGNYSAPRGGGGGYSAPRGGGGGGGSHSGGGGGGGHSGGGHGHR